MNGSRCVRAHLHTIDDTVQSIFDAADPRLHPHAVASLHAVALRRPAGAPPTVTAEEAYAAAAAPAGMPATPEAGRRCRRQSLRAVRRWAAAAAAPGVDVVTATAASVQLDVDARGGRRVVLFRSPAGGGYCPAVAVRGDRFGVPLPQVRPSPTRAVVEAPPSMVAVEENTPSSHWTYLFLSADVEPIVVEPWRSWPDLMAVLAGPWGAAPAAPPCAWPLGVPADARLDALAAWADYHRTVVRVRYRGDTHFRLLPRSCAAAHGGARAGRAVYVEVGDDGGRLWHSPFAPEGRRPYMGVFVDDQGLEEQVE